MRQVLALAAAASLALLLSGCSGDSADDTPDPLPDQVADGNMTLPAPLSFQGEFLVGLDPTNAVTGTICFGPSVDPPCYLHDFSTNTTVDLEATLSWGLAANDLDLYLYEGDVLVSQDGINTIGAIPPQVPGTEQVLRHAALPPGDYTLYVVAWNAAAESYTLDVSFS